MSLLVIQGSKVEKILDGVQENGNQWNVSANLVKIVH